MVDNDRRWSVVITWRIIIVVVVMVNSNAEDVTPPLIPPPPPTTTTTTTTTTTPRPPLPRRPRKPHIILIVADDLGWNDVSWNNPKVVTPHLGELATGGVILNQSYVLPTCTPTRAALLTGRYPFTIGMQKGALNPMEPRGLPLRTRILPQALKKLGYSTHAIGKWHLGFCSWRYTPTRRGFDTFYGYYTGSEDYYSHMRNEKKITKLKRSNFNAKGALDLRNNTSPDDTKKGIYSTYLFASVAEDLLRSRKSTKPMFLYLPFQSVHAPLQVPKNYTRVFSHVKNYFRRNYLGMVMAMDDAVGRVVASLKATGHYDNSIIIFTTDNGGSIRIGASNWPLRGGKSNLLEGGTRGAAFIHSPHLPNPGSVSNQLVHVTDWFSTIVKLAGGVAPGALDGYDQWYSLAGLRDPPRRKFIYNIDNSEGKFRAALRMNDLKLSVGHVGTKDWAPLYPVRFRKPKTRYYVLPENYDNNTDMGEILRSNLMPSSWRNKDSSNMAYDTLEFALREDHTTLSGFHLNGSHFTSSEEEQTNSLNENEYDMGRSSRMLDPYTAVYGRTSDKKMNKSKVKQTKNKANNAKKKHQKKQIVKKPNKVETKNKYKHPIKIPTEIKRKPHQLHIVKKPIKTNNENKQIVKKPNKINNKYEPNVKKPSKPNNKGEQNVKRPNKTNNKKQQNKKPNNIIYQNKKRIKIKNKNKQNQKPNKTKKKKKKKKKNKEKPENVKNKKKKKKKKKKENEAE